MEKLNKEYIDIIKTIQLNPKFILAGSCALHVLGLLDRDIKDIDFNLTEPLTKEDIDVLVNKHGFILPDVETINRTTNQVELKKVPLDLLSNIPTIRLIKNGILVDIFNHITIDSIININSYRVIHPSLALKSKINYLFESSNIDTFNKVIEDFKVIIINKEKLKQYKLC